ncbi:MAG: hypothetical protein ACP5GZ_05840 [Vulcanisaeta sp.]
MRNTNRGRATVFVESHNWIRHELNGEAVHIRRYLIKSYEAK